MGLTGPDSITSAGKWEKGFRGGFPDLTDNRLSTTRKTDVTTDYDRHKYLLAFKLDGFDTFRDTPLRYLELHLGYYARGYDQYDGLPWQVDERFRTVYVGVGLNVGRLLKPLWDTQRFNYIQMPYTYAPYNHRLD